MVENDYYEEYSEDNVDNSAEEHPAAYVSTADKLASICKLHDDWCKKIVWS
jgi:hypothetical protein